MLEGLANRIGRSVLPYSNPRVVAPPGRISATGRPNVMICTPRRSGTHLAMDLVLNNLPEYRRRPLYANLDVLLRTRDIHAGSIEALAAGAGIVIKTHFPLFASMDAATLGTLEAIARASTVIAVRRDPASVARSLKRWKASGEGRNLKVGDDAGIAREYDEFWAFWTGRTDHVIAFEDLFRPEPVAGMLALCRGGAAVNRPRLPAKRTAKLPIYLNKALTRALGRHAPRIDTTIYTGK